MAEEDLPNDGNISQQRDGQVADDGTRNAHVGVAEEVSQVTAEEGQHKPHRHLRLLEGDGGKCQQQGDQRPNNRPGQKTQHGAVGLHGNHEADHGGQDNGAVD